MSMPEDELYEYAIREYNLETGEVNTTGWSKYGSTLQVLANYREREQRYVEQSGNPLLYTYRVIRRPKNRDVEELDV